MQGVGVRGGGSGAVSARGGSSTSGGSMSAVSKEDNLVLSSEDSSSCLDESELELGLGLSLGGSGRLSACKVQQGPRGGQYTRILTAKDFPYLGSSASASSSSSSSSSSSASSSSSYSSLSRANVTAGTKRSAESVAAANGASQVVGWPPIRAYRMNSLVNQAKLPATEEFNSLMGESENSNMAVGNGSNSGCDKNDGNAKEQGLLRTSLFVKVNMDGTPIGRKIDLSAHSCYETLAQHLEDMFQISTTMINGENHDVMVGTKRPSRLLDGSSEFVLTYEDKDGDWMLVGDVPWRMFIGSVRRLRIMRASEANGLDRSKV